MMNTNKCKSQKLKTKKIYNQMEIVLKIIFIMTFYKMSNKNIKMLFYKAKKLFQIIQVSQLLMKKKNKKWS